MLMTRGTIATTCLLIALAPGVVAAETCTTLETLLPAPMDSWELFNEAPATISETVAEVRYSLILPRDADGNILDPEKAETVGIRIDATPENVDGMKRILASGPMEGMLENGPLDYPAFGGALNTVVGDFHLTVDGNGPEAEAYYTAILGCALGAGLEKVAEYGDGS